MIILDGYNGGVGSQYGDGRDGEITITSGTVNIEELYETSGEVLGATTKNGADQGLGYGLGSYDPENGAYPKCTTFTIDLEATLTHGTAMGTGSSNKNGIVWVACTGSFTNNGTVDMDDLGYNGGAGGSGGGAGSSGVGSGGGLGGNGGASGAPGGNGGISYGTVSIPTTTWADLHGSGGGGGGGAGTDIGEEAGGGGGGGGHSANGSGGIQTSNAGINGATGVSGGLGGGALRIYATKFITSAGLINCDGKSTANASTVAGIGGGGSGGTVYIETYNGTLGTNLITCSKGTGGFNSNSGGSGGDGATGRIHIEGAYIGTTSDPAIA